MSVNIKPKRTASRDFFAIAGLSCISMWMLSIVHILYVSVRAVLVAILVILLQIQMTFLGLYIGLISFAENLQTTVEENRNNNRISQQGLNF